MLEIRAFRQEFRSKGIAVFIDDVPASPDQKYLSAKPLEFRERELFETNDGPPTVTLKGNAAQILMDDLWDCGLRPSEGTGSAGQLAAVQNHLADFKAILFHKLRITQEKRNEQTKKY